MIKATTTANKLRAWLRPIAAVSDECILDTSELDTITTCVVDPANAQMVSIRIPDHAWDDLEVDGSRIGVDLPSLIEKIAQFHIDDQITLTTETDDIGKKWIKVTDEHDSFTLEVLDPGKIRKTPTEPAINSAAQFAIIPETLKRIVERAELVSDCIRIGMDPAKEEVWMLAKGDDKYEVHLPFIASKQVIITHKRATVSSLCAIDYLKGISPHLTETGSIMIGLGDDETIQMCCMIYEASVRYRQAPRIE